MNLHDKVESFLSLAEVIHITSEGEMTVMSFLYPKERYNIFSDLKNHSNLRVYFRDKNIKMVIDGANKKTTFSLVNIETADSLNIENVKFIDFSFDAFIKKIPENREIAIILSGLSADGSTMVMQQKVKDIDVPKIHGYSYINRE